MRALGRTALVAAEILAGGALLAAMVISPPMRPATRADAVVLLSGDGDRLAGALKLMERGVAPTLVFVGVPDTLPVVDLCRTPHAFEVVCLRPQPDNTRTEAQVTGQLGRTRKWETMVIVTSRYHVARARLLFGRCFGGRVEAVGDYPRHGREFARQQVMREWLALVHTSFLTRGC